jgi:hypothetical protein
MFIIFIFKVSLIFLVPGVLENCLQQTENVCNMGLYGVILDIYTSRNIVYLSLFPLLISYFYNYLLLGSGIFLFSLWFYIKKIFFWKNILEMNFSHKF